MNMFETVAQRTPALVFHPLIADESTDDVQGRLNGCPNITGRSLFGLRRLLTSGTGETDRSLSGRTCRSLLLQYARRLQLMSFQGGNMIAGAVTLKRDFLGLDDVGFSCFLQIAQQRHKGHSLV